MEISKLQLEQLASHIVEGLVCHCKCTLEESMNQPCSCSWTHVEEMFRDDFDRIYIMTMLIGYNDFNGEGIDTIEYRSRYMQFLRSFREVHNSTLIYCLSMTYTTNTLSAKTGIPADDFRAVVKHIVGELNAEGDERLFFIEGDEKNRSCFYGFFSTYPSYIVIL